MVLCTICASTSFMSTVPSSTRKSLQQLSAGILLATLRTAVLRSVAPHLESGTVLGESYVLRLIGGTAVPQPQACETPVTVVVPAYAGAVSVASWALRPDRLATHSTLYCGGL